MPKRKSDNWKVYEPTVKYFEQTDIGDALAKRKPKGASVKITSREFIVTVDEDVAQSISQIAGKKKISSSELLHRWLKEKVAENSLHAQ